MASPAPPTAPVPPPPTVSVASAPATVSVVSGASTTSVPTAPVISPKSKHSIHKCDLCEFTSMSKHGVSVHMGHSHRKYSNCEDSSINGLIEQIDGNTELEEEDKSEISNKSLTEKVIMKEAEVQTKPGFVTLEVKEVAKTYEIFVKESLKENINQELESFWEGNGINGFSVKQVFNNFHVDISCWEFSESFTAFSAASLLKSIPWPDGVSLIYSKPTRYLEKNSST